MSRKTCIKKHYEIKFNVKYSSTGERTRDIENGKQVEKLLNKMTTIFMENYQAAVKKLIENEEIIFRQNQHWEDIAIKSSVKKDISFEELLCSLKEE